MADFWGQAIRGYDRGIIEGTRRSEREADQAYRDKALAANERRRGEDVSFRNKQFGLQEKRAAREQKDFDIKTAAAVANKEASIALAYVNSGNDFAAAKTIMDMYKKIPNGDDILIFSRNNDPGNKVFEGVPKGMNVVVRSKKGGVKKPYKNMRELVRIAALGANAKQIVDSMRLNDLSLAKQNASEKPFMDAGSGKYYRNTWVLGDGGFIQRGDPMEVTGPVPAGAAYRGMVETLGRKPTGEERRIAAGLKEKQKQPKVTTPADTAKAKKAAAELTSIELNNAKKKLDIVLMPFNTSGKSTFDFTTGQLTTDGVNSLQIAQKLVEKAKTGDITADEARNLNKAKEALALYDEIFGAAVSTPARKQTGIAVEKLKEMSGDKVQGTHNRPHITAFVK